MAGQIVVPVVPFSGGHSRPPHCENNADSSTGRKSDPRKLCPIVLQIDGKIRHNCSKFEEVGKNWHIGSSLDTKDI